MINYYKVLGINSSATDSEIRRAYRILARRYHPDLNPNQGASEKFKAIAEAHSVLSDPEKRKQYDYDLDTYLQHAFKSKINAYKREQTSKDQKVQSRARERYYKAQKEDLEAIKQFNEMKNKAQQKGAKLSKQVQDFKAPMLQTIATNFKKLTKSFQNKKPVNTNPSTSGLSILEVSVSILEALKGTRKTIEIEDKDNKLKKFNIRVPAGVYNGSIIRLRSDYKELVIIVRVARHPFVRSEKRGVVIDIPITINEAIAGATIKVPTLEEPVMLKVPAGTQSGTEFRIRSKGVHNQSERGDVFAKVMINIPEDYQQPGLKEKSELFKADYKIGIRQHLPTNLGEL